MKRIFLILFINFLFIINLRAQISSGGYPVSSFLEKKISPEYIILPTIDNKAEVKKQKQKHKKSLYFANVHLVNLNRQNAGQTVLLNDNTRLWQLGISSPGALSLNLTLSDFKIPPGAKLFIYSPGKKHILGAFTSKNNKPSRVLAVAPIPGDKIIIEYIEPANCPYKGKFSISRIGHDFVGITKKLNASGACNVDINCIAGNEWKKEKRSVCKIIINNNELCSGVLVNNTANDGTPYLLTANHTIQFQSQAENSTFIFNYENTKCNQPDALEIQSISGANIKASAPNERLDFTLLQLSEAPPANYMPYYAGWDVTGNAPDTTYCIHHPNGDAKKISIDNDPAETGDYEDGYDAGSHWWIKGWDIGTTEDGSSGSPIFDKNHRIKGTLTGGEATCANPYNDYFAKISRSWNDFSAVSQQLEHWLDPLQLQIDTFNGFDPYPLTYQTDAQMFYIESPMKKYCSSEMLNPVVRIRNMGTDTLKSANINALIDGNIFANYKWTGNLPSRETEIIELPEIELTEGLIDFKTYVHTPNEKIDQNFSNDTLSQQVTIWNGINIRLRLKTDYFGQETWWEITDSLDNVVYSGDNYANRTTYTENYCLNEGCYTFTIYDRNNDGICCLYGNGEYTLTETASSKIIAEGGEFTDKDENDFCIVVQNINIPQEITTLKLYPNPAKNQLYVENIPQTKGQLIIFNALGQKVFYQNKPTQKIQINLSKFDKGIYFMKFFDSKQSITQKFLIIK